MGLRAINNPKSSFEDPYLSTGKEAAGAPPKGNEVYATGGTKTIHPAGYTTHVFDYPNSDSFVVSSAPPSFEIDYLVIGGGGHGAGPGYGNGGGGAGGNITQTHFPVPVSCTIPITVGQGGQSAPAGGNDSALNCPWLPAPAQAKTAYGGGKGGGWLYPKPVPNAGGSAGGGGTSVNDGLHLPDNIKLTAGGTADMDFDGTNENEQLIGGQMLIASAAADYALVFLQISP